MDEKYYWAGIGKLTYITYRVITPMLHAYGTVNGFWNAPKKELLSAFPQYKRVLTQFVHDRQGIDIENEYQQLISKSIMIIGLTDPDYPELLKHIPSPPVVLYYKGSKHILKRECISIVGTRKVTDYGEAVIKKIVPPIIDKTVVTVSGLAFGVDKQVHLQTMYHNGQTIAVIPGGIHPTTPRAHTQMAESIICNGGAIISEHPPGTPCIKQFYARRNRIIAGLSLVTTVVEAPSRSGALITAYQALEYNRTVCAVPGRIDQPYSNGCNRLIQKGAYPVLSADDIIAHLPITVNKTLTNTVDQRIIDCIRLKKICTLEEVLRSTHIQKPELMTRLAQLELDGFIQQQGSYIQAL